MSVFATAARSLRSRRRFRVISADNPRPPHPVGVIFKDGTLAVGEVIPFARWNAMRPDARPESRVLVPGLGWLAIELYDEKRPMPRSVREDFEYARELAEAEREMRYPD